MRDEFWDKLNAVEFEMPDYGAPHNAADIEDRNKNRKRSNVDKENNPHMAKRPQNAVSSQSRKIDFQRDHWV